LRETEKDVTILMRFIKSLPECLVEVLNQEFGKLKKSSKDHQDMLDIIDMSASFIDVS
jgi:hypothetical protein